MVKLKLELNREKQTLSKLQKIYDGYKINHESKKYVKEMVEASKERIKSLEEELNNLSTNTCIFCGKPINGDHRFCDEECLLGAIES